MPLDNKGLILDNYYMLSADRTNKPGPHTGSSILLVVVQGVV